MSMVWKIKRFSLSLLFGFISFNSLFAQQSWSMPFDTSSKWQSNSAYYDGAFHYYNYEFYVSGDTVINSISYFKIFQNNSYRYNFLQGPPNWPDSILCQFYPAYCNPIFQLGVYYCAMRSDSMKVYGVWPNWTSELIFYDFDLTVGVNMPIGEFQDTSFNVVKIDTILTGSHYRRRFACQSTDSTNFCHFPDTVFYYDGIGSMYGFLINPICSPLGEQWGSLDCYAEFGMQVFPQNNGTCDFSIGISEKEPPTENLLLYPNPAYGDIVISSPALRIISFSIFNSSGKFILQQEFDPVNNYLFNSNSIQPGFYFIEAITEKKTLIRIKLIVAE